MLRLIEQIKQKENTDTAPENLAFGALLATLKPYHPLLTLCGSRNLKRKPVVAVSLDDFRHGDNRGVTRMRRGDAVGKLTRNCLVNSQ